MSETEYSNLHSYSKRNNVMNKVKTLQATLLVSILSLSIVSSYAGPNDKKICGAVKPLLSVADVNANGTVDLDDIKLITIAKNTEQYIALYDFDTNGKIDDADIDIATSQIGQKSLKVDQQIALLYNRNKQFQFVSTTAELTAMGYVGLPPALAGHGEHWVDLKGPLQADPLRPEGINVPSTHDQVSGLFWGINATPVFESGATDYPTPGGAWETQRVVSFSDKVPKFFDSPDAIWHKHAALCITGNATANGTSFNMYQYMTFAECKAKPSIVKNPKTGENYWVNIYMLHAWIFDLNPKGVFANTHTCVDPNAIQESSINGNRVVPPFFQH